MDAVLNHTQIAFLHHQSLATDDEGSRVIQTIRFLPRRSYAARAPNRVNKEAFKFFPGKVGIEVLSFKCATPHLVIVKRLSYLE